VSGARSAAARMALAALAFALGCRHENAPAPEPPSRAQLVVSRTSLATVEGGAAATFDIVLLSRPTAPVEVEVRSDDPTEGLVLAPGYALAAAARVLTFTPGDWDVPRRIAVQPVDDHVIDGTVVYTVSLGVAYSEDPAWAAAPRLTVKVTNSEGDAPGVAVSPRALTTFEALPFIAKFRVALKADPGGWISVAVVCTDPTEGLFPQYGGSSISLWFDSATWDVPQEVWVAGVDDPVTDGDRTYAVTVQPVARFEGDAWGAVPPEVVWVTNVDDETPGFTVLASSSPLVTVENGATATFQVVLNAAPAADVVIPVTSGNPAEGLVAAGGLPAAASVALTFTPLSWSVPQTVTVVPQDDEVAGDDVAYVVTVGPPTGDDPEYPGLPARTVAVLNLDDDVVELTVDPAGPFTTSETGTTAAFTVSIHPPKEDVFVTVTSGDPAEGLLLAGGFEPAPAVTLVFSPESWGPHQVTIVGQPDQVLDGDVRYLVTVAAVSGDPRYVALAAQGLAVTNTADYASSVPLATYDQGFGAPRCASIGFGCGSGTLLAGRDGMPSAPEAHAPNTLTTAPACADGDYQWIVHALDVLKVFTLDGSPLAAGKTARIEAKVRLYYWSGEFLDLYSAGDASAPSWSLVATLQPPPGSTEWSPVVLGTTFTLPSVTTQAIRGNWRYGGFAPSTCSQGSLDDHDDLVFEVAP